jgi:hypothetical protein
MEQTFRGGSTRDEYTFKPVSRQPTPGQRYGHVKQFIGLSQFWIELALDLAMMAAWISLRGSGDSQSASDLTFRGFSVDLPELLAAFPAMTELCQIGNCCCSRVRPAVVPRETDVSVAFGKWSQSE